MIKLNLIKKSFNNKTILENIKLNVKQNDVIHLIAPSGTGKTSLLRILMNVDKNFEGEITNNFKKMSATYPERVFMGGISVYKEIEIFTGESRETIEKALKELHIHDAMHKKASELSTGMRSRASIIRSMIVDSEIVYLDEPLLGLDYNTKEIAKKFIQNYRQNKTIIYTGDTIFENEIKIEL